MNNITPAYYSICKLKCCCRRFSDELIFKVVSSSNEDVSTWECEVKYKCNL